MATLDENLSLFVERVAEEFNAVRSEIPTSGGGSGPTVGFPVFIQNTQPVVSGPYTWWDTSNNDITLWIEDGS
jgi:hypothetical protein